MEDEEDFLMSSFTEPLIVQKLPNGTWKIVKGFRYYIGHEGSEEFIDIPEGFETDFASTPWGVRNMFPKDGPWSQAAVVHDMCYQKRLYPRKRCDQIFLEAMTILGVPWWKRRLMYSALRIGGWVSYYKNPKPQEDPYEPA